MRYQFADCQLDTERRTLLRQGQPVRLQPRVFELLAYLLAHHQRVVPRQELFDQVWQGHYVSKASLDGCIKQVRQAIGDSGRMQRLLQTQHGVGYRFVAPVRVQETAEADVDTAEPSALAPSPESPSVFPPSLTERRQLTVLSCALVAAPHLFSRLDADDLHGVLRAFHSLCADTVVPYGGTVAQRVDDHCLIYFGYPQAHGDDARRAVLCALQLIASVRSGLPEVALWTEGTGGVRVGIHTGEVVVDSVEDGGGALVVGSVATLASALREVAEPQTVVISADTARLVEGYISSQSLPPVALPGRRDATLAYRVTGASGVQMRLDRVPAQRLTPFVGREAERALLTARWGQVRDGRGQAVLISGEAGIGKSRLVRTVAEQLASVGAIEGRGSPYHQQSAFYALTDVLRHLLRLDTYPGNDPVGQCEAVLQQCGMEAERHLPFIAPLLNLTLPPERYPASSLSPQQKRQRTFESLLALVLASDKPLLLILEDLHWVDPSTLEWLGVLLEQLPTARVLLLMTCRPEFEVPWASRSYLTQVTLDRLETRYSRRMVESIVHSSTLPPPVIEQIIEHSDGVPLFIEELSRTVLDTGTTQIPTTLQDTLTARLDQVGVARRTAQLGAVMGRQFSDALLQAVSPLGEEDLRQDLRCLLDSELVYQRGVGEGATYQFKHALIQDAAYGSLLRRNRQQLHRQIAEVLETQFPQTQDSQPELLAHHFTEAGIYEQALTWWQQAGQQTNERAAHQEAIRHLKKGLDIVATMPDTLERSQHELDLQIELIQTLRVTAGQSSPEVEHVLTRAHALCEQLAQPSRLFPVLQALTSLYYTRGEFQKSIEWGKRALTTAQMQDDPMRCLMAHKHLGLNFYATGELVRFGMHMEQAIALYEQQQSENIGGHDRGHLRELLGEGATSYLYSAWGLWMRGYPDQAQKRNELSLRIARETEHPGWLSYALLMTALVLTWRREDVSIILPRIDATLSLCEKHGYRRPQARGIMWRGWALAMRGQIGEGIALIRKGMDAFKATGSKVSLPIHLAMLAEAYARDGQIEAGLAVLDEALAVATQTGERSKDSDLYRLKGELLLRAARSTQRAELTPEAYFLKALDIARRQQARSWELRAATSLACLWQQQGKRQDAYDLLAPVYGWFTEGFDTADLQEAKTLLDALS